MMIPLKQGLKLHKREFWVQIAVAKRRGFTFASDDLVARREARLLNVPLTGTVGILVSAVNSKVITLHRGETILTHMKEHGFYAPVASIGVGISVAQ